MRINKLILKINRSTIILIVYLLLSLILFILIALPILKNEVSWNLQFYSDTKQYENYYDLIFNKGYDFDLVSTSSNLLGPLLLIWLFSNNYWLIYIFNCLLFIYSLHLISNVFNLNKQRFYFFLVISTIMLSSLLSVNKEILSLLAIALLLYYFKSNFLRYLIFALIVSLFTRWQLTFIFIIFFILIKYIDNIIRNRLLIIAILLIVISIIYPLSMTIFSKVESVAIEGESYNDGSGLYTLFLDIQRNFGYFLVYIPKTLHQLIGIVLRYKKIFEFKDFYNDVIIILQSFAFLIQLILIIVKKINFRHPVMYLIIIYTMVFALSPIFAPRYFFPVYILLAIYISDKDYRNINFLKN